MCLCSWKVWRACYVLFLCWLGVGPRADAAPTASDRVYTFDARSLDALDLRQPGEALKLWDTLHTFAALQGLANRSAPRLYLLYCQEFGVDTDAFWLEWLRSEDGWLKEATIAPLKDLELAVRTFRKEVEGLVVYDGEVPATSNLASTAAGCDDLIPVRYDPRPGSVFDLLAKQLEIPVKLWLVNTDGSPKFTGRGLIPDLGIPSTGSAKADVHLWGLEKYVKPGRCAPGIGAYYVDAFWTRHPRQAGPSMHTLPNHDYFIARKAFFFDLSPWGDEAPNDDPNQPLGLDKNVFLKVLRALYDRTGGGIIKLGGFPPWPYKYTTHAAPPGKHEGVPTEWEFGRLISQFNAYKEADAAGLGAMANASFFQHYPLAARYSQPNRLPNRADWRARGWVQADGKVAPKLYVGHYVGDYDSPSWLYKAVAAFFKDPARGQVPLGWAFDPNLADRAPQALVYAYRHASTNCFFIAGDSGAGYLNPRGLTVRPDSGLPSGLEAWRDYCAGYYARWDMTITGFILDGSSGASTELEFAAYHSFSPLGAGTHFEKGPAMKAGIPTCPEVDLPDRVDAAAGVLTRRAEQRRAGDPSFFWARSILKSPAWYADLSAALAAARPQGDIVVVDPYSFFGLIREHLSE